MANCNKKEDSKQEYEKCKKYLNFFFPLLPLNQVKVTSNITKEYEIYGLFSDEDFDSLFAHLIDYRDEEEFFRFINNQKITINLLEYMFLIKNQSQLFTILQYEINNESNCNSK
jgi:hypothetical protein